MIPIQRTCDVENMADFVRYYSASWVGWHPTDGAFIQPCYVANPLDMDTVHLRPLSKRENNHFLMEPGFPVNWKDLNDHIDFGVPDIGMMPDGPTVCFCSYATPRIARKGYRSRHNVVTEFNNWYLRKKYVSRNRGVESYDWTWFAFNPEYLTLQQAENKFSKGEVVGVPLSKNLAVYIQPGFKHSLLAYKRWTVGHIVSPYLINLKKEYVDYEEDIARQTGAEVIVG